MSGIAGPQRLEIAKHSNGLLVIAALLQGMGQFVGRFWADGAGGGVEANRLVAARQFLERPAQLVVNPGIPRIALLSPAQHRLGQRAVASPVQTDSE